MNLNELKEKAYKCACEHGFHEEEYSDEHYLMLIIGEVAEMVEADRNALYPDLDAFEKSDTINDESFKDKFERYIKNTVYDEIADIVIRQFDLAGLKEVDLSSSQELLELVTSGVDNGLIDIKTDELKSVTEFGYKICSVLISGNSIDSKLFSVMAIIAIYCKSCNINIEWFIEQKMRYNELRPYRNGKNY